MTRSPSIAAAAEEWTRISEPIHYVNAQLRWLHKRKADLLKRTLTLKQVCAKHGVRWQGSVCNRIGVDRKAGAR